MSTIKNFRCDFCGSETCNAPYTVPYSDRGTRIAVCMSCGLLQSVYSAAKSNIRNVSISSAAGWGNIRHGKGLRLKAAIPILETHVPLHRISTALDVGSNRGDFLLWLNQKRPGLTLSGIEPDPLVVDAYKAMPNLNLHLARFENLSLPAGQFDLIYCSHTLEHATSANLMLRGIYDALKPGGRLFLEVPNIAILADPEISEEFFIDKHTFHFEHDLLREFLVHLGFNIVHESPVSDITNITFVVERGEKSANTAEFGAVRKDLAAQMILLLNSYDAMLTKNREVLKHIAKRLNAFMERQRVGFWGGGRIFDALVRFGGLKTDKICVLIDTYIGKYVSEVHSVTIRQPDALKTSTPQVLVVLARTSTDEIIRQAKFYGVSNIITFSQLYQST